MDRKKMGGIAVLVLREVVIKRQHEKLFRQMDEKMAVIGANEEEFGPFIAKMFQEVVDRTPFGRWMRIEVLHPMSEEKMGEMAIKMAKIHMREKSIRWNSDPIREVPVPAGVTHAEVREFIFTLGHEIINDLAEHCG